MNASSHNESGTPAESNGGGRRGFVTRMAAIVVGAVAGVPPLLAGLAVFLNPLKAKRIKLKWVKVAGMDEVPSNGEPRSFPVISDRWDAWNYYPPSRVGAVYLRRVSSGKVQAFTATCPHLGCFVEYRPAANGFKCPCHDSAFKLDGSLVGGVSARGMDELKVDIRKGSEVWVAFQKFQSNKPEKIAQ